jgi:uncharacterized phiE125 gp8 family phage protein
MLVEQTSLPVGALPLAELREHLRLGTGFTDAGVQDGVLEACLRAAIGAVEARTSKVTLARSFTWTLLAWRDISRQALPVAPVSAITRLAIIDRHEVETVIDGSSYRLERDAHRPAVAALGLMLPVVPVGGTVELDFDAGFAPDWAGLPPALAQAVLMLAAHYYEHRVEMGASGALPETVTGLLQPFQNLRLFGRRG